MATAALELDAYWMPFTANRDFKTEPRMIRSAAGHHYVANDGRRLYDFFSGLWTSGVGHCHPKIVAAVQKQVAELDYAIAFQVGNNPAAELAARVVELAPAGFSRCFFTNSGSESVDTALKIALAYHRARGESQRTRLIGRERGYHGVNFGGMSVGGMVPNRRAFSANLIPGVDHLPATADLRHTAFSRGQPAWGAHLADELERLCALHDAGNIAAVIVEPVAGSAGVLPPPLGYLEKLRAICDRHGILLIFDEVITAFGRVGKAFAAETFGVTPDIITTAKGLTNGVIPMGAVLVREHVYDAFMQGPEHMIEFMHGYTYSGNPMASAAGLATLETYKDEGLLTRGAELAKYWEDGLHSLKGEPHVIDVRNIGLVGAVELQPIDGQPTKRAFAAFVKAFETGILIRTTGDIIAMSPPLIVEKTHIDTLVETLRGILKTLE